jgi:uncharacterized membrane protein YbhN (UPF0104 family)
LATRVDLGQSVAIMAEASLPLMAATLVMLLAANFVVAARWHLVLSAEVPSPGIETLLKIVLVGLFFNQVLPTGVGGDAVRAWRCRRVGIGLGTAIRSILLDRACGYVVLVVVYAATLPALLRVLPDAQQRDGVIAVFGAVLLGLLALLFFDCLPGAISRVRVIAPLADLSRESRRLFTDPARCGAVLGLSTITIGMTILAFDLIGTSIGSPLPLTDWIMVVPPITMIQLLPVSLAGWGVREVVLVVALASFGVPAEAALAISVLLGLSLIVIGVPGGVIWLIDWDIARPIPGLR